MLQKESEKSHKNQNITKKLSQNTKKY